MEQRKERRDKPATDWEMTKAKALDIGSLCAGEQQAGYIGSSEHTGSWGADLNLSAGQ